MSIKTKAFSFVIFIFFFGVNCVPSTYKPPSDFPTCSPKDKNFKECLLKATEEIRPFLSAGIPELKIPPLSVFYIPEVTVVVGNKKESVHYEWTLRNVSVYGLDQYVFSRLEVDMKNKIMHASFKLPHIHMKAQYEIGGKILLVPLTGKGDFANNVTNTIADMTQKFNLIDKNGGKYIEPYDGDMNIKLGKTTSYSLSGLFPGNKELADLTTKAINDNFKELEDQLTPSITRMLVKIFQDIIFRNIARIPSSVLFPE